MRHLVAFSKFEWFISSDHKIKNFSTHFIHKLQHFNSDRKRPSRHFSCVIVPATSNQRIKGRENYNAWQTSIMSYRFTQQGKSFAIFIQGATKPFAFPKRTIGIWVHRLRKKWYCNKKSYIGILQIYNYLSVSEDPVRFVAVVTKKNFCKAHHRTLSSIFCKLDVCYYFVHYFSLCFSSLPSVKTWRDGTNDIPLKKKKKKKKKKILISS